MIEFGPEVCGRLGEALGREWLETNGLGGYASSTVAGLNTRRYHGLLVAATRPPVGRTVLLAKLEEALVVGGRRYELSANQYPGVIHPQGQRLLRRFRLDPFPVFTYEAGGVRVEKSVLMPHGENTTVVRYALLGGGDGRRVELELRPLVAFSEHHHLGRERDGRAFRLTTEDSLAHIALEGDAAVLRLAHDASAVEPAGFWYRNFVYAEEQARGFDFTEDLFNPCALRFDLTERDEARVVASTSGAGSVKPTRCDAPKSQGGPACRRARPRARSSRARSSRRPTVTSSRAGRARRSSPAIIGSATGGATR